MSDAGGIDAQELLRAFETEGYLLVPGVIDDEAVATMREFLDASVHESLQSVLPELGLRHSDQLRLQLPSIVADHAAFGSLSFTTQQILSGHFSLEVRLSEALRAIPRSVALQEVLRVVLGSEHLRMHMPPTARFVLPGNKGAGVPAHQDVSYNQHMSNFITCWTPFTPIDEDCGGVVVHRGSGRSREVHPVVAGDGFWHDEVVSGDFEKVHVLAQPGDVLLLDRWTIHESRPNRSQRTRLSVDQRFFGAGDTSSKHYLDMKTWTVVDGNVSPS